ncbi:hypothetical protein BU24DRAFT_71440 [Aaosphaeria arxii CBS 175.79]|uniref:Secreted protein n=1 Tax=Aaosphaeria arxii CBS 175.79 TaxID=1450172 RepID=A0A6A5XB56_9PLEO|nr:uncharacterized protein BU24DRAFT_71440 [Aaosphaeria arxii CBS 175.79]KAF2010133.1 hypothetical protein BU24DRAFT_71440 [Aaosphaeria arxii CBS 175.79]
MIRRFHTWLMSLPSPVLFIFTRPATSLLQNIREVSTIDHVISFSCKLGQMTYKGNPTQAFRRRYSSQSCYLLYLGSSQLLRIGFIIRWGLMELYTDKR